MSDTFIDKVNKKLAYTTTDDFFPGDIVSMSASCSSAKAFIGHKKILRYGKNGFDVRAYVVEGRGPYVYFDKDLELVSRDVKDNEEGLKLLRKE